MKSVITPQPRTGCKDMWNAFVVKKASFDVGSDMPICISTDIISKSFILYEDAKKIYKKEMIKHNKDFFINSFIVFYLDDHKFDGKRTSIWTYPSKALKIIRHFARSVTPDFSTLFYVNQGHLRISVLNPIFFSNCANTVGTI